MKSLILSLLLLVNFWSCGAYAQEFMTAVSIDDVLATNHGTQIGTDIDHSNSECALRVLSPGEGENQSSQTLVAVNSQIGSQILLTSYYYPFGSAWQMDERLSEITFNVSGYEGSLLLKFNHQSLKIESAVTIFQGIQATCDLQK